MGFEASGGVAARFLRARNPCSSRDVVTVDRTSAAVPDDRFQVGGYLLGVRKATGALATVALLAATLFGAGCGGGDDVSKRAVEWGVDPPVGPNWARINAAIEGCNPDLPLLEKPIIEYKGNRVYVELRRTPEDGKGICVLNLPNASKKITFERDLDELVLFDASTDPPEKRWPRKQPRPRDE
jgi:hypothetical protein